MTLRDLLDRGFMALNTMIENATIYYGTTGSGKTTLTSYLFGKNVEANFN
jgi:replication-associated recombination protein RarA